jgi:F-type H+-transporting ATPase subunit epsilon
MIFGGVIMASAYPLEIVTPDKNFFEGDVEMVIVRTAEGDVGILNDHEPLVAPVSIGSVRVKIDGKFKDAACSGGFLCVEEDKTTIVTDCAEWADEIDANRAKAALDRAQKRLEKKDEDLDTLRAKIALNKAINRIRVSGVSTDK